jgi:fanconi-associated nuclease 1
LKEIREGKGKEIMERVDGRERERGTWAVGVRWEVCGRQELGEIIEVRKLFM